MSSRRFKTIILLMLVAANLCLAAAISEQLTAGNRLRDGVRLITGLIAARLMLRVMTALLR